ncbi:MAG: undecaprenyldiphospho-muramoylpentapeptide beta-N-acetylglucosaminyltransferase [Alistipes sp.]|nr:undecaprenyldiphospho-muramoylpentapeptide beta-N-acetylglucosaminyltransferase [Candidatus Alistipes equi]
MVKIILSGGGTGGHIYPAVAVAQALTKSLGNEVEILFVGAEGKMESQTIPRLGYKIECLPIAGLQRSFSPKNLLLPFKILRSLMQARKIIKKFQPQVVAGFGGYASAPIVWAAQKAGVPTVIQEQNSYAGLTNKLIARRAKSICVAWPKMERFFPKEKIVFTGNPLRSDFALEEVNREEALKHFGLNDEKNIILVVGGSLGTRTLNEMMKKWLKKVNGQAPVQVIWQTGKYYWEEMHAFWESHPTQGIWHGAFIQRMDYAYAAASVVISRSGACSVSELCLAGKATIFVPSPNVAEDHQTKNAMSLVEKDAALMVADAEAPAKAIDLAIEIAGDRAKKESLENHIQDFATPHSAADVAKEIIKYC